MCIRDSLLSVRDQRSCTPQALAQALRFKNLQVCGARRACHATRSVAISWLRKRWHVGAESTRPSCSRPPRLARLAWTNPRPCQFIIHFSLMAGPGEPRLSLHERCALVRASSSERVAWGAQALIHCPVELTAVYTECLYSVVKLGHETRNDAEAADRAIGWCRHIRTRAAHSQRSRREPRSP